MKKNKMMRIAAALLIVTLLSTCIISGTFAKYVAKADVDDSARVAKWGIKIETSGDLFKDKYETDDEGYYTAGGKYSVESAYDEDGDGEIDKVVAPGTTSITDDGMGFTARLYGKPEVATRFQLKLNLEDIEDVFMPFGEGYTDYSEAVVDGQEKTFDLVGPSAADVGLNHSYVNGYAPVKWDVRVTRVKDNGQDGRSISLSEMAASVAGSSFGELYESLFTKYGISITDAKTIIKEVYEREDLGLKEMIMNKINQQFAGHGFRNLQIEFSEKEIILSMDFDANENCNYRFEGGWTWAYEVTDDMIPSFIDNGAAYKEMIDKADTYLGNVAAGIITDPSVSTNLKFAFEASATQID